MTPHSFVFRLGQKLTSLINGGFLVAMLALSLYVGFLPAEHKYHLFQPKLAIVIGAIAVITVLLLAADRHNWRFKTRWASRLVWVAAFVGLLGVQLAVSRALQSSGYSWDSQIIFDQAVNYAQTGSITDSGTDYIRNNPNNIGMLVILGGLFRILHVFGYNDYLTGSTILASAVLWMTAILTFLTSRRLYGNKIAGLSLVFIIAFITLSLHTSTPYTDTFAIVFPIALIYGVLRFIQAKLLVTKIALAASISALAVIGALVKPTVSIAFVAIIITGCLWLLVSSRTSSRLHLGRLVFGSVAASAMSMAAAYLLFIATVDKLAILPYPASQANAGSIPPQHYIAIGMKTHPHPDTTEYGGFDKDQYEAIIQMSSQSERVHYSVDSIQNQLAAYGPLGYIGFLVHKANWITSDGTFYAYGEGSLEKVSFTNQDTLSTTIRDFMYISGRYYGHFTNVIQAIWIAVLLLIAMQIIFVAMNVASRFNLVLTMPRLMLAGIILFLLLFEGRSRYLYLYVPIFIITALYTLKVFETNNPRTPH